MENKILLVEDDCDITDLVVDTLASEGFEVITAKTTDEALDLLRNGPQIDLLFTDLMLPGSVTGKQMIQAARELHPALSVVYTTGYYDDDGALTGLPVLHKPYRLGKLIEIIRAQFADA